MLWRLWTHFGFTQFIANTHRVRTLADRLGVTHVVGVADKATQVPVRHEGQQDVRFVLNDDDAVQRQDVGVIEVLHDGRFLQELL